MVTSNSQRIVEQQEKTVRNWFRISNENKYLEDATQSTLRLLDTSSDKVSTCASVSIPISKVYFYWLVKGTIELLDGNREFMSYVYKGYGYFRIAVLSDVIVTSERGFYSPAAINANEIFHCINLALFFEDNETVKTVANYAKNLFEDGSFAEDDSLDVPYGMFTELLAETYLNNELPEPRKIHPSFVDILDNWEGSSNTLESAVIKVLDYHTESVGSFSEHQAYHIKYFSDYVYAQAFLAEHVSLLPIELMALYRVRLRLGLDTPIVNHPLIKSDLIFEKGNIDCTTDGEILTRVEALIQSIP